MKKSTLVLALFCLAACKPQQKIPGPVSGQEFHDEINATLKDQVMEEAAWALLQEPVTVTAHRSARSAGGPNDFFSEGDYWWPDPKNPTGTVVISGFHLRLAIWMRGEPGNVLSEPATHS